MQRSRLVSPLILLSAIACSDGVTSTAADQSADSQLSLSERETFREARVGAVYVISNSAEANAVMVYPRRRNGKLDAPISYGTGGRGTGGGLGNQYGLVLSEETERLYAVDAGSDEITTFAVDDGGLRFVQRTSSNGSQPISIAMHGRLLYVLNDGANANITGFFIRRDGSLTPIAGSTRARSAPTGSVDGAEISFSPDGRTLVVTEKAANLVVTYPVLSGGLTGDPRVNASSGTTPFGFDFTGNGTLIVSEAFGGAAGKSTVSSYTIDRASQLSLVSASVPNGESAVCWVVASHDGKLAFVSNTGSNTVNAYAVSRNGELSVVDGSLASTGDASGPTDMALSRSDKYLYVRNGKSSTLSIFMPERDGSLKLLDTVTGLPAGANGLAAR